MVGCNDIYSSYLHGSKGMAIASKANDCGLPSSTYKGQSPTRDKQIWVSQLKPEDSNPYQNEWEDLLEAMVGEIVDEGTPAGSPVPAGTPDLLEVDGSASAAELAERFDVALPAGQASTIGGRLVELAGRFPVSGERFLLSGLEIDVLHASPNRVERLLIRRGSPGTTPLDRSTP